MINVHEISHYLILEATDQYSLSEVISKLKTHLEGKNDLVSLIVDIRQSTSSPSHDEIQELGEYFKSIESQLSGGVYITGDELRYGLSNIALSYAGTPNQFQRVKIG